MIKRPVRNLHSPKPIPTRFCDVIVDGSKVELEVKNDKNKYDRIPWGDVVTQVNAAIESAANQ